MNWQQRSGQIYANLMEPGLRSIRAIAAATGIAKAACIGLCKRLSVAISIQNRPVGTPEWLPVVTQIGLGSGVCVRVKGIGNETLSEFFHILHLEGRIGVSNALQGYERKSSSRF